MFSLTGFRPPQFSEDDAWLPPWLQQCGIERLNVERIYNDRPTLEQRIEGIEELQYPAMSIITGESFRDHGGCNVGQLFLSGTVGSPISCAQSPDNVVQFHLCLFSDEYSENTSATCQTKSMSHCSMQPQENSAVSLRQKAIELNSVHNSGAVSQSPTEELEIPVHEPLTHEGNMNLSKATDDDDDVELCIGASEALVIDEIIKSDSSLKSFSASSILEVSLQVKQARLEVCDDLIDEISEIDDLSDLDDSNMESAYGDIGLCYDDFTGNNLSVSQVKDTFDSECKENIKFDRTGVPVTNYGKFNDESFINKLEGVSGNGIQPEKNVSAEFICDDTQNKVTDNLVFGLGYDGTRYQNDCSSSNQAHSIFGLSTSEEKVNATIAEKNCQDKNVFSSPIANSRDAENDKTLSSMFQERFQSRWFGGWTCNIPQNEMKCATTVNHNIPEPFAGETSFFSESASDGNSFVHHKVERGTIASQLSTPSQNFPNNTKDRILLSQDFVRSSSASLSDPLCSVVPCSISENVCLSPTINHNHEVLSGHFAITTEQRKENLLGTSASKNELAGINDSPRVSRKVTSLRNYSKLLPIHAEISVKDCHKQRPPFLDKNPDLMLLETPLINIEETAKDVAEPPSLQKEKCNLTVLPETNVNCTLQWESSNCKKQDAQQSTTAKRVRFSENETNTTDKRKLPKIQTTLNNCSSTRATRRSTRSSPRLDSRCQQLSRFFKKKFDTEKKRLIFQNMEFVITGFSCKKEEEIEGLIRKYGGVVLSQVPSVNLKGKRSAKSKSQVLPVVICLKKIQSFKFLYGCAVNALILKVNWLIDSIAAGLVLPPKKYMVLSRNIDRIDPQVCTAVSYDGSYLVFNNIGVMLHGKTKSFSNIATIIKHGGGQVFKTLQKLVQSLEAGKISTGVVVTDDENSASRHLKHCASEHNIPMKSVYWIIRSLYAGRLIPLNEKNNFSSPPAVKRQGCLQLSQEI